jgi:hypothetical protein
LAAKLAWTPAVWTTNDGAATARKRGCARGGLLQLR